MGPFDPDGIKKHILENQQNRQMSEDAVLSSQENESKFDEKEAKEAIDDFEKKQIPVLSELEASIRHNEADLEELIDEKPGAFTNVSGRKQFRIDQVKYEINTEREELKRLVAEKADILKKILPRLGKENSDNLRFFIDDNPNLSEKTRNILLTVWTRKWFLDNQSKPVLEIFEPKVVDTPKPETVEDMIGTSKIIDQINSEAPEVEPANPFDGIETPDDVELPGANFPIEKNQEQPDSSEEGMVKLAVFNGRPKSKDESVSLDTKDFTDLTGDDSYVKEIIDDIQKRDSAKEGNEPANSIDSNSETTSEIDSIPAEKPDVINESKQRALDEKNNAGNIKTDKNPFDEISGKSEDTQGEMDVPEKRSIISRIFGFIKGETNINNSEDAAKIAEEAMKRGVEEEK